MGRPFIYFFLKIAVRQSVPAISICPHHEDALAIELVVFPLIVFAVVATQVASSWTCC